MLGVPAALIFIGNANGSHNPDEAMAVDEFQPTGTRLCSHGHTRRPKTFASQRPGARRVDSSRALLPFTINRDPKAMPDN
jgi:hypothetical protein